MQSAFSRAQIAQYLEKVGLSTSLLDADVARDVQLLEILHVHHISTFPYENLSLHYNPQHRVSLHPETLFQKFVGDSYGRGGYCFENSILMKEILRGVGFHAYIVGARARPRDVNGVPAGMYGNWVHCVIIATLGSGERYHVDVGFGGDGPTKPMPLVDGAEAHNLGTQDIRLSKDDLPGASNPGTKPYWIYQYRNGPEKPWNAFYAFPELEFLDTDLEGMNIWVRTSTASFQTVRTLVVKFVRAEDGNVQPRKNRIVAKLMMVSGVVKENLGGKTQVIEVCNTEEQRIAAFQKYFNLRLKPEQVEGIKGYRSELHEAWTETPLTAIIMP